MTNAPSTNAPSTNASFLPDTALAAAVAPTPNHDRRARGARPDMIVLHYTGMTSGRDALERLTAAGTGVSAHYLIDEAGRIIQMAREESRAWHAGVANWRGERDVNSLSIGVEIQNPGHDGGCPPFPDPQMEAVVALCRDIIARHGVRPQRVLAHSDVAPARKRDPGEKFDWGRLARAGVGLWVEPAPIGRDRSLGLIPGSMGEAVGRFQSLLAEYGYGVGQTRCYDEETVAVVRAFQRHFRPERVDGCADPSTIATLERLLAAELWL